MRVAVHIPEGHPEHGGGVEGDAVVTFRIGRIVEGEHNAPPGFEPIPLDRYVQNLVADAEREYPGCRVVVERLIDNGDDTASWIPASEFDPERHTPQGAGTVASAEFHVTSDQEA